MIWVAWRQFRAQAVTALVLLAGTAIALLVTGLGMHHSYTADLASCTPQGNCGDVLGRFEQGYQTVFLLLQLLVIVVPALMGIFWGAPLIGRELETGTHQLAWNQTVTRTRWLAVKLACVGAAAIVTAAILSWLLTWWAGPLDHINGDRWNPMTFVSRDIVPLGYAAFAFALGTTLGLVIRRTLPAMAITLALFIAIQILIPTLVRPHLLPSTTVSIPINQSTTSQLNGIEIRNRTMEIYLIGLLPIPQGAWVISAPPVEDSSGHAVAASAHLDCFPGLPGPGKPPGLPGGAGQARADGPRMDQIGACLANDNLHETVTYQPASHYWPLQWAETGIFLVLAGALSGICFWWIRRRQN